MRLEVTLPNGTIIRQSETFAREGIELDVSTLADWVGACSATLAPLVTLIGAHVMAGGRIHGDDTTVPVLARGKTVTGRLRPIPFPRAHQQTRVRHPVSSSGNTNGPRQ